MSSSNFMQKVEGSEQCVNGHLAVDLSTTSWKCDKAGCEYSVAAPSLPDNTLRNDIRRAIKTNGATVINWTATLDRLESIVQDAVNEATVRPVADLAECLGVLRGLGHPNKTLEAKYDLTKGETDGS